jgi:ABC-type polysaccharide/polyol phosphate export permease
VMGGRDWRAFATTLLSSLVATAGGVGAAHLAAGLAPIPLAVVVVGIFGVGYFVCTLVLRHPDAARLWTSLR